MICCCCSVSKSCLTLQPHGLQQAWLPCPSLSPGVCSNLCPLSRWCHPTISSSVALFSSYLQSFPAPGSFQMSQLFTSSSQSIGVSASASVLPVNIEEMFLSEILEILLSPEGGNTALVLVGRLAFLRMSVSKCLEIKSLYFIIALYKLKKKKKFLQKKLSTLEIHKFLQTRIHIVIHADFLIWVPDGKFHTLPSRPHEKFLVSILYLDFSLITLEITFFLLSLSSLILNQHSKPFGYKCMTRFIRLLSPIQSLINVKSCRWHDFFH